MSETFRVLIERYHQAADKDEAARVAVAETVKTVKAKNARNRAEMERAGVTWALDSEDPKHYVVKGVRRAPKRRTA
jgi:hypothetical protein